eukprot:INCI6987.1.p1 GENE.INCI6987.1~~INCI6987.1.p1  ORF type:complete len:211 (-),score=38.07 INCI6987.1:165-797(-)
MLLFRCCWAACLFLVVCALWAQFTTSARLLRGQDSAGASAQSQLQANVGLESHTGADREGNELAAEAATSSGMRIMSRSQMLAERRAAALAPLDTITAENAASVLRATAHRLQQIYEADVADPKFGSSMPSADVDEFKGTVSALYGGLAGITTADLQDVSEEDGAQAVAFVRHLAKLTDDLSNSGMPNQQLMREMENVYSEGEPLLAELN